ncbi:MAG: hypothetical protein WAV47_12055, partial [Blastocatellia bacterium]
FLNNCQGVTRARSSPTLGLKILRMGSSMHDLLKLLSDYHLEVETRAFAHYSSSNYHRRMGVRWGIAASGLTGSAGLATLAGAAMQLDPVKAALVQLGPSIIPKITFLAIVLFAFAIASALEAFLAHPKQAASHMSSYAGYSHAMRRLETLRIRCANPSIANNDLSSLLNLLDDISQETREVAAASIYPLPEAYNEGKMIKQSDLAFSREWETTFGPRSSDTNAHLRKNEA